MKPNFDGLATRLGSAFFIVVMAEEITTDVSESTAAETVDTGADTPVQQSPADAPPEESKAEPIESDAPAEDLWDKPLEFPVQDETSNDDKVSADVEKEGDKSPAPESGATAKEEKEDADDDEDLTQINVADIDPSKPPRLSRKQRDKVVADVIDPIRDPNTPIEKAWESLYSFNPDRTTAMINSAVEQSVNTYPDEWLSKILGDTVTVADVKERLSNNTPTQARTQELDSFKAIEATLTDTYGEDWKDPSKDEQLIGEDVELVKALRAYRSDESAKNSEIAQLKEQIESLKPEIQSVKEAQAQEAEREKTSIYETSVNDYRGEIEKNSLDRVFTDAGLADSETDTADMKTLKGFIRDRFSFEKSGDFDRFVATQFSNRDKTQVLIQRVDQQLSAAAEADAAAKRAKGAEAEQLQLKAKAYRSQAKAEQAALTVLHRKASNEFLETVMAPVMAVIKENSILRHQNAQTRPEMLGNSVPDAPNWKAKVQEAEDPWEEKAGWDAVGAGRR